MKDPLAILGLSVEAGRDDIERAYGKLVRRYPPELNPQRFAEIHGAYRQLTALDTVLQDAIEHPNRTLGDLFPSPKIRLRAQAEAAPELTMQDLEPLLHDLRRHALRQLLRGAGPNPPQ